MRSFLNRRSYVGARRLRTSRRLTPPPTSQTRRRQENGLRRPRVRRSRRRVGKLVPEVVAHLERVRARVQRASRLRTRVHTRCSWVRTSSRRLRTSNPNPRVWSSLKSQSVPVATARRRAPPSRRWRGEVLDVARVRVEGGAERATRPSRKRPRACPQQRRVALRKPGNDAALPKKSTRVTFDTEARGRSAGCG